MTQTERPACSKQASTGIILWFLLGLNGLLVGTPKLFLIKFTNDELWGDITWGNLAGAIAQDALVAIATIALASVIIRKADWKRLAIGATLTGGLLVLLMLDMRVRELWLKPIDIALLRYALDNASDLTSGTDLFFKHSAIHGITFRKLLFFVGIAHVAIWCMIAWAAIREDARGGGRLALRRPMLLFALTACVFLVIAVTTHDYRYRINENIVVGSLINTVRSAFSAGEHPLASLAAGFEQKAEPLSGKLKQNRTILRNAKPFKNVVVIVYESVRWRDLGLIDSSATTSPTLARMASQGILSKSYVSVPHSSKAYFAILSGRHPYPGVEMREVVRAHHDSIWHEFSRDRNGTTFAFSSLYLGFENMGGLLKTLGTDQRFRTDDLAEAAGAKAAASSSFGTSDDFLYALGAQRLSKTAAPFAAIFFPSAAHYPYECPGAVAGRHSYADYTSCVKYSDNLLAEMIEDFRRLNLIQDTLFVIVGDHGESFGEHGLFVHNSSMYEEEVSVPLVFWSDDGRLAHHFDPVSRQIDIVPTIADLLGMMSSELPIQGVSLLRRNGPTPPVFMSTFFEGVGQALVEPPYKYIYEASADRLFAFDLNRNPNETSPDVISDPKKQAIVARLRAFLAYQELAFPQH